MIKKEIKKETKKEVKKVVRKTAKKIAPVPVVETVITEVPDDSRNAFVLFSILAFLVVIIFFFWLARVVSAVAV
jgi:hypothetical protein